MGKDILNPRLYGYSSMIKSEDYCKALQYIYRNSEGNYDIQNAIEDVLSDYGHDANIPYEEW